MYFDLSLDIVSFFVLAATLLYFGAKRKSNLMVYRVYYVLILLAVTVGVMDIFTEICCVMPNHIGLGVRHVVNYLDLVAQYLILPVYTLFMLTNIKLDERIKPKWLCLIFVPYGIVACMSLIYAGMNYADGRGIHMLVQDPQLRALMIVGLIYYQILGLVIGIYYRKGLRTHRAIRLVAAQIVVLLLELYQLLNPHYRVISFVTSLVLVDMIFSVQRPEEIFDITDAMRKRFLLDSAEMDYTHGKIFYVIFIRVHDYNLLMESFGKEDADGFMRVVASWLGDRRTDTLVYQVRPDILAVRTFLKDSEDRRLLLEKIRERFKQPWRNGILESMLSASFIPALCPAEVPDFKRFQRLVSNAGRPPFDNGAIVSVEKLLADDKELQMLEAIRRALDENLFQVFYQPIYSTKKKKIVAAEALIRLFDPVYGFIPPEPMIALAEREGYILRIGEFVFTEVCRFYSENHLDRLGIEYVEVNLSAVQCMQNRLAEEFMGIMRSFELPVNAINFEITETAAMNSNSAVSRNISHFETHGVSLSLDDYGTGYSNISYLYNLPFMLMKIDKSLLWAADTNEKADITLRNTFRMARKLHMKVVMEGVETEEQIRKLLGLECDYFQGYYFSKPVKGEDFLDYIRNFTLPEVCAEWKA